MKQLQLTDRVVVEIMSNEKKDLKLSDIAYQLRYIADQIEDGMKGDNEMIDGSTELLWEHESKDYGSFRMGNRSLIRDAYYGAKEFYEVCSVSKEDIEQAGFDASKLTAEDMQRIASKQGDLITDCCDYWTTLEGACEYWEVPSKDDDIHEVIPGTLGMLNELSIRE